MNSGRSARDPVEQGTGVVEGELDRRVALEGLEHRQVGPLEGLGDDPAEVAHGLMVVERQGERDATGQAIPRWAQLAGDRLRSAAEPILIQPY